MPKYRAKPVLADAWKITRVVKDNEGAFHAKFDDRPSVRLDDGMLARYRPVAGDYYIVQSDGYAYVNPAAVFERKYEPLELPA